MYQHYYLDKTKSEPIYVQLYELIKQDILQNKLHLGDRLPSKRQLKEYLQISQNTVEGAYDQLLAEGYIESVPRKGFFISFKPLADWQKILSSSGVKTSLRTQKTASTSKGVLDLNPNYIDQSHFPLERWRKSGRNIKGFYGRNLLVLGEAQGEKRLREQITKYLAQSRGVNCQPEQIIVSAGAEGCLQKLILLFNQRFSQQPPIYAMERYGYENVRRLLALYQQKIITLPFEQQTRKLDLDYFNQHDIDVAYLTPSNIYPFGQVLSISQRQILLSWANQSERRYIIEDDYDSEFRYKGKPIPSLQSLDKHQKVIYVGSFSKLLMPSLRVGFMVLPESLLVDYQKYCGFFHSSVSRFEQSCLAEFIQQNEFEKHIHRMRKIYREKMMFLCQELSAFRHKLRFYGENSGFHLLIELLDEPRSTKQLTELAFQQGVKIYSINMEEMRLFAFGFANLTKEQIQQAVHKLALAWKLGEA